MAGCLLALASPAHAQMQGMDHSKMDHAKMGQEAPTPGDCMTECLFTGRIQPAQGSGTSRLPGAEGMMHGQHIMTGDWMVMLHGYAWLT